MTIELPKSVRQIGNCKGNRKIYVEDYVMSFAKQLAAGAKEQEVAGVLLGRTQVAKGMKYIFVSGMVEVRGFSERCDDTFSHDMWTGIYTDIKENFTGLEIVGWFYSKAEMPATCTEKLRTIHGKNFAGDKLLFIYEEVEKEEAMFLNKAGVMEKLDGYYIYYEKNAEMREYMVMHRGSGGSMEQVTKDAAQSIRSVLQEKKGIAPYRAVENDSGVLAEKKESRYSFGMGAVVVIMALALGFVALRNQNSLHQVENQITTIKETFGAEDNKPSKTEVETLASGLSVTKEAIGVTPEQVSGAAVEQTQTPAATVSPVTPAPDLSSVEKQEVSPTPTVTPTKKKTRKKTKETSSQPKFWYYTVKKGDTLSEIAEKLFSTVSAGKKIKEYNHLSSEDEIREGQLLKIPQSSN